MDNPRINIWERKLLDLTLSNALINTRYGNSCISLQETASSDKLSQLMANGPIPLVASDEEKSGLHTCLEKELMEKTAKSILRNANSNQEETGSEQLFIGLGMLRWIENPDPLHPNKEPATHEAPAMLLPVHISRQRITGIFYIHPTGEDPLVNITLVELLKQEHERDLSSLIPKGEEAIPDYQKVEEAFRHCAESKSGWAFNPQMCLGLFSFSKFVMWNDIHSNSERMRRVPMVESLVQKRIIDSNAIPSCDARQLDQQDYSSKVALPIEADSSQIEAIVDAANGRSFLLYGPPGTGKSQTITNMIANSLSNSQSVLFVAQKRAALEVVQERLTRIGIAPYCIELHSNKATKSHLIIQLSEVLSKAAEQNENPAYRDTIQRLTQKRKQMLAYIEAVHAPKPHTAGTYSLADCIEQCIALNRTEESLAIPNDKLLQTTNEDLDTIENILHEMETIRPAFSNINKHPLRSIMPRNAKKESLSALQAKLQQLRQDLIDISLNQGFFARIFRLKKLLRIYQLHEMEFNDMALSDLSKAVSFEDKMQLINSWLANWSAISEWSHWSTRYCNIVAMGYPTVAEAICTDSAENVTKQLIFDVQQARAWDCIENDDTLVMFHGNIFDEVVCNYRRLINEYQTLTAENIVARLQNNAQQLCASTDQPTQNALTAIRRWIKNHGRGMSIRNLFATYGDTIRALCPCMLMSPISVAQYLTIDNTPFNLVLFDEASQIPTAEAVGAIARGRATIIVGDPKQMPPTTFFQTRINTEDDIENNDMESILDDCITLGMPEHYLNCHYRSRHESLIAFSNRFYYDNRLLTFPSVDDRDSHIHYRFVPSIYDYSQTRTNRLEAEAIVNEVIKRLQNESLCKLSMGIIAFSKVQQDLIEDLLQERIGRNAQLLQRAYGDDIAEPLFVKNLENVQGDERDVILFSVCYGPNETGKISMNFGPLNNNGGERRLNVAVTRARQEMFVFSGMHSSDIDLEKSQALGVQGLKNFLYYAENGILPETAEGINSTNPLSTSQMAQHLAMALRKEGYQVDLSVGKSDFRIDVAVVDPSQPGKYKLGILFDGHNYYHLPMMRDREVVQPQILESLGWQLLRIWQVDYFKKPEVALKKVLSALHAK